MDKRNRVFFSILLPTKDRLDLLQCAVKSILMQSYDNWELIISDNCSKEDIETWVDGIGDARIKYIRQVSPISVTENWNATNECANGDYMIMLGDDDALLPNALRILAEKITSYNYPELIVFPAYLYLQPNVDPVLTGGDLQKVFPLAEYSQEQLLDKEGRIKLVSDCCRFERSFGYNMQFYCYSKELEKAVEVYGNFYEPPYPDYYTASLMLYIAERVLHIKDEITIIGVTPKSYGYFYRNNIEREGMIFHKEADYREYAPAVIRSKLCSVDEMDTAAAATFALLTERIENLEINIFNYYKAVIKNQLKYWNEGQVNDLINEEMLPHVNEEEKAALKKYLKACCENAANQESKNQILGTREIPYSDVMQIIADFEQIRDKIASGTQMFDIDNWLAHMDIAEVGRLTSEKQVFIWGAYVRGMRIRENLELRQIPVSGYIDTNLEKKQYDSHAVFRPEDILQKEDSVIILAHKNIYRSVTSQLQETGYTTRDGYIYFRPLMRN